jgi:hypothetical protein
VLYLQRAFLVSGLLLASCVDLLGDVAVEGSEEGVEAPLEWPAGISVVFPGADPSTPNDGAMPSDGAPEQLGPAEGSELGQSGTASTDVLAPALDRTAVCALGTFRCEGAQLELCLNGAAWVPWQLCGSPVLCQSEPAGRCLPSACTPDEFRCVDGSLERCDTDVTGWTEVATCATPAHCDPLQDACLSAPCAPGQQRCNGGQVEECRDDRLGWDVLEDCGSAALCESGPAPGAARCIEPVCDAEQFRCAASGVLQVCNLERTGFTNLAQCATAALCDAELGRCEAPACQPGQHACTAAGEIMSCNAARDAFVSQTPAVICSAAQICNAARGVCEARPVPPPPPPPPPVADDDDDDRGNDDDDRGDDDDDDDDDDRGNGRGRNNRND